MIRYGALSVRSSAKKVTPYHRGFVRTKSKSKEFSGIRFNPLTVLEISRREVIYVSGKGYELENGPFRRKVEERSGQSRGIACMLIYVA